MPGHGQDAADSVPVRSDIGSAHTEAENWAGKLDFY